MRSITDTVFVIDYDTDRLNFRWGDDTLVELKVGETIIVGGAYESMRLRIFKMTVVADDRRSFECRPTDIRIHAFDPQTGYNYLFYLYEITPLSPLEQLARVMNG